MANKSKTKKILFVEDNPDLLRGTLRNMRRNYPGWDWDLEPDVDDTWRQLCSTEYDCLVIDVMLPTSVEGLPYNSEGVCLAKWIRGAKDSDVSPPAGKLEGDNQSAPILFLSSRNKAGVQSDAAGLDGCDFCERDEDPAAVLRKIDDLMAKRQK